MADVRPLRALAGWLTDEGVLTVDPFRRARRFSSRNPLLPSEDTPTKSATLADVRALERDFQSSVGRFARSPAKPSRANHGCTIEELRDPPQLLHDQLAGLRVGIRL